MAICDSSSKVEPTTKVPERPRSANLFINHDFCVRMNDWFRFGRLLRENKASGLEHTTFRGLRSFKLMTLSQEALRILILPNAGGNSIVSEVLSYEVLRGCFRAQLLKTEMEVVYFPRGGSITDYVARIFDVQVGVSVTRAMKFGGTFEEEDAEKLLRKKLRGVHQATQNTQESWAKQILHVWAENKEVANVLEKVFDRMDEDIVGNTVVLVTNAQKFRAIFENVR